MRAGRPRVAIVGVWHETNSYASRPATLADFEEFELLSGQALAEHNRGVGSVIGGFLDAEDDFDLVPVFSAGAWPSGPASAQTWATIRDRLVTELAAAGPLDGVLVNLHGAMVAEGCSNVEVATATAIREVVGEVPLAAVLDLHANIHPDLTELVEVLVGYDTYPHVDMRDRGREAAELLGRMLAGERLCTVLAKSPLLTCPLAQGTEDQPMRGLLERARDRASEAGVVRVSIAAGFPYDDVATVGNSAYVVAAVADRRIAARVADETIADIEGRAHEFGLDRPTPDKAVAEALEQEVAPVVLADVADNVGGGCPGDGTAVLVELLAQQAPDAVVIIADREVAAAATRAGEGAVLTDLLLGGKTDRLHGEPVRIPRAEVVRLTDGDYVSTSTWQTGQRFTLGPSALLRVDGVQILVTDRAVPPFHRDQLTLVGIDPARTAVLVAKSAVAWRAAFGDAALAIEVDGPGACPIDLGRLPRTTTPMRVRAGEQA
ncbi:MAG TPA: M81 family metallopeptidase [Candidatus Avipropionibacterium avicola]|uniref:M81 family metallopeptidase n=1 Tax=Candidatus Avipropionibacterium avicola TaxID=2840701 RepID=A0A9D1GWM9_9ACTN|nr:M81 family metallopeptidase [Candidatus Avipropionibacterium avicola]